VRLRRRVSSTVLNPAPSRGSNFHLPSASLSLPPSFLPLFYCPVVLVLTLSRGWVTLSLDELPFRRPAPSCLSLPLHLLATPTLPLLLTHGSLPSGFIREAKCAGGSYFLRKRERNGGREGERGNVREKERVLSSRGRGREQKRELCGSYKCFGASARP